MASITVENLHFAFTRATPVLRGVNLRIESGEFLALVGRNGSGKTTLCKHLTGLLRPDAGRVMLDGRDIRDLTVPSVARTVGYCFQNPDHQITQGTIRGEVSFGPIALGLSKEETDERTRDALHAVGLWEHREEPPDFAGRGERQRVALAAVLAMRPSVLIMDEPTTGLDWPGVLRIMDAIHRVHAEGTTVIMITQDMDLAARYPQRVVAMDRGRVAADGAPPVFFSRPTTLSSLSLRPPSCACLSLRLRPDAAPALTVQELASRFQVREGRALVSDAELSQGPPVREEAATSYAAPIEDVEDDEAPAGTVRPPLKRLHPSGRLAISCTLAILPFLVQSPGVEAALLFCAILAGVGSGMPRTGWRMWALIGVLGGLLTFLTWLPIPGELGSRVLFRLLAIEVTEGGIVWATAMSLRMASAALGCIAFVSTSPPKEISVALLGFGAPYHVGYLMSLAFRLLPMSQFDARTIREAQWTRGLDFDAGNFADRIRRQASIIGPLTLTAMRRVRCIANSLDARGLWMRDRFRKPYNAPGWRFADAVVVTVCVVALGGGVWLRAKGVWILVPWRP